MFKHWFNRFLAHYGRDIYQAYKNPSSRKISVWCTYYKYKSHATILGFNCHYFTVGYLELLVNNKIVFCVETSSKSYRWELNEAEKQLLKEVKIYGK